MGQVNGTFINDGQPRNGATAKLWQAAGFGSPPAFDAAEPSAGYQVGSTLTTGTDYGGDGMIHPGVRDAFLQSEEFNFIRLIWTGSRMPFCTRAAAAKVYRDCGVASLRPDGRPLGKCSPASSVDQDHCRHSSVTPLGQGIVREDPGRLSLIRLTRIVQRSRRPLPV